MSSPKIELPDCYWRHTVRPESYYCRSPQLVMAAPVASKDCRGCELTKEDKWYGVRPAHDLPEHIRRERSLPCKHLGELLPDKAIGAGCCANSRVEEDAYVCKLPQYGRCTRGQAVRGVAYCQACTDYDAIARVEQAGTVRNLLYHVYPIKGNGMWQRNAVELLRRINLFNGRRVVAIVTDASTDPPEAVKGMFYGQIHEFIEMPNDPNLREVLTLIPLLERVETTNPGHATFYGHTKGVTRPVNEGVTVHPWADLLYETNLDYPDLVLELLKNKPVAGSLRKLGAGFAGSVSQWHYSGSFFWFRNADLFARDWRGVDRQWWGVEAWLSLHFDQSEAATVFHEGQLGRLNMYDINYLKSVVLPELEGWRQRHAARRKVFQQ